MRADEPSAGPAPDELIAAAVARLDAAGVPSALNDAEMLLAHVLGARRGDLALLREVPRSIQDEFGRLVERRGGRVPLQHLIGSTGFRYVELAVGPGVFTPRPETELLAGWAIEAAQALAHRDERPVVVDLCTGSGAIARSIADEVALARVHAVELDPGAHHWAEQNLASVGVDLRLGDMADAFTDLDGTVDVVVCNPPYIPLEAWETVAPEARDHDPHLALFSGVDGLVAMRVLEQVAARLLRPGGVLGAEHADLQGTSAPAVFANAGRWSEVRDHLDLAGRPRYLTARLAR